MRNLFYKLSFIVILLFSNIYSISFGNEINSGLKSQHFNNKNIKVEFPDIIVKKIICDIKIHVSPEAQKHLTKGKELFLVFNNKLEKVEVVNGVAIFNYRFNDTETVTIQIDNYVITKTVKPIPLWLSIFPPLIAIFMALLLKEVFTALFAGLFVGTSIISFFQPWEMVYCE